MLFLGLLIFIFLIIIRPQDFVPGLKGYPLVFVVMGIVLVGWVLSPIQKKLFRTSQDKFVGLFFLAFVLSTISVNWITYSITTTIETLKIALIYFFIVTIVDTERRFKIVTWTIVILITIVGGMGVMQAYGYDITGAGMLWSKTKKVWQIKGIGNFDNPNDLAYSVVLVVPFAFGLFWKAKNIFSRVSAIFLSGLSIYCIYLTMSRGGLLALIFGLIVWWYFWISNIKLRRLTLILGVIGIVIAFSMQTEGYRSDESAMGRVEAWSAGMSMLQRHPVIGVGKGQFMEYHERDSHSSYVRAGAELGILGLYAWLGMIYFSLKSLWRLAGNTGGTKWKLYTTGYSAFIGSYACASIFSTRTYDIVFLVVVAITSAFDRLSAQVADNPYNPITAKNENSFFNRTVAILTVSVLLVWKLFLIQVW